MSDILSMVALRDRIKQILLEPTLDKALTAFSSIMLMAFTVTLLSPIITKEIQGDLLIMEAVSFIGALVLSLVYKRFDQQARDATSARLKKEIEFDYLIRNPKLKETEIKLDCLEQIMNEMSILRQLVAAALNGDKVPLKFFDPNEVNKVDSMPSTPWSKVDMHGDNSSTYKVDEKDVDSSE